jgi:REP element-mobilizing transposase RayT
MAWVVVPGYPHHVTQRANRRQRVFFGDDDCERYLGLLDSACREAGTRVLAYCLMPNPIHFVMGPTHEDGRRAAMAQARRRSTRSTKFREGWRCHLWQERFHSFVLDEAHLHAVVSYVEDNLGGEEFCRHLPKLKPASVTVRKTGRRRDGFPELGKAADAAADPPCKGGVRLGYGRLRSWGRILGAFRM